MPTQSKGSCGFFLQDSTDCLPRGLIQSAEQLYGCQVQTKLEGRTLSHLEKAGKGFLRVSGGRAGCLGSGTNSSLPKFGGASS